MAPNVGQIFGSFLDPAESPVKLQCRLTVEQIFGRFSVDFCASFNYYLIFHVSDLSVSIVLTALHSIFPLSILPSVPFIALFLFVSLHNGIW